MTFKVAWVMLKSGAIPETFAVGADEPAAALIEQRCRLMADRWKATGHLLKYGVSVIDSDADEIQGTT